MYEEMQHPTLRTMCRSRGLPATGTTQDLAARLVQDDQSISRDPQQPAGSGTTLPDPAGPFEAVYACDEPWGDILHERLRLQTFHDAIRAGRRVSAKATHAARLVALADFGHRVTATYQLQTR